jgi:hypothetical protein
VPFKVWAGTSTLITPLFGIILRGGYVNGFYATGPSYSGWLAQVEGRYAIGPTVRTAFGYLHDISDSVIANFYEDHVLYARAALQLAGRWQGTATGELHFRSYSFLSSPFTFNGEQFCTGGTAGCSTSDRFDLIGVVRANLDYQINAWLFGGVAYLLTANGTDSYTQDAIGRTNNAFVTHELMAQVAAKF